MPDTDESINEIGIPEIEVDIAGQDVPELQSTVTAANLVVQPTDKTLRIENMPADAKAVGDAIAELQETERDTIADVAANTSDIEDLQEQAVLKSDIETTLETSGMVADSKATGDAINAAKQYILGLIDTTLSETGGIAEAEATGQEIAAAAAQAVADARDGVILSIDGIEPDSTGAATLASLIPTTTEINSMIDTLMA